MVSGNLTDKQKTLLLSIYFKREVERIGAKVDAATLLEKFITNMQRERSEVSIFLKEFQIAKLLYKSFNQIVMPPLSLNTLIGNHHLKVIYFRNTSLYIPFLKLEPKIL